MNKNELVNLAEEAGLALSPRATKVEIAAAILAGVHELDETQKQALGQIVKPVASDEKTAPILIYRDYWDSDGARHPSGATVMETPAKARELISEGKAERADPMPGE